MRDLRFRLEEAYADVTESSSWVGVTVRVAGEVGIRLGSPLSSRSSSVSIRITSISRSGRSDWPSYIVTQLYPWYSLS